MRIPVNRLDARGVFGQRLRKLRLEKEISIRQLAVAVGCTCNQITGAEVHMRSLCLDNVMRVAQVLDCSIDYLCGLEDDNGRPVRPLPGEPLIGFERDE